MLLSNHLVQQSRLEQSVGSARACEPHHERPGPCFAVSCDQITTAALQLGEQVAMQQTLAYTVIRTQGMDGSPQRYGVKPHVPPAVLLSLLRHCCSGQQNGDAMHAAVASMQERALPAVL